MTRERKDYLSKAMTRHGMYNTQYYKYWQRIKKVQAQWWSTRWKLFDNFFADMGFPPNKEVRSLRRKDVTLTYCKDNCYWA